MNIEAIIDSLSHLPLGVALSVIGGISAIENIFPPFPADAVVAFGSFLAARGTGSPVTTFSVAWLGNILGAAFMYYIGRRYGSGPFLSASRAVGRKERGRALPQALREYGLPALFVSRFLPAVRSLVPPFAGAMKLPPLPVALAVARPPGSGSRSLRGSPSAQARIGMFSTRTSFTRVRSSATGVFRAHRTRRNIHLHSYRRKKTLSTAALCTEFPDELSRAFHLERFHDFLAVEKGASPRTDEAYLRDLARFATFARLKGAAAPTKSARGRSENMSTI